MNKDGIVIYSKLYHPGWQTMPRCNTITLISTSNRITILSTETLAWFRCMTKYLQRWFRNNYIAKIPGLVKGQALTIDSKSLKLEKL